VQLIGWRAAFCHDAGRIHNPAGVDQAEPRCLAMNNVVRGAQCILVQLSVVLDQHRTNQVRRCFGTGERWNEAPSLIVSGVCRTGHGTEILRSVALGCWWNAEFSLSHWSFGVRSRAGWVSTTNAYR
jgi:hypothetical protein